MKNRALEHGRDDNDFETLTQLTEPPPRIGPKVDSAIGRGEQSGMPEAM